ncbi:MAG TPA: SDR family NAD(P)-dependent oxidoreductase, partial [Natrialbaceae archaeon]|nr:SDR family NAD(P)-dependent oxidoreductase [Natrialbaceae archaeon]
VLITGAGSGIGAATVRKFLDRGWTVWATDVDEEALERLPSDCHRAVLDVTDPDRIEAVVEHVLDESGRLDCLVNNAGFAVPGTVEDVPREAVREVFDVVVHGAHDLIRATLPHLRNTGGTIVNVSSVLGRSAYPGLGAYCSAKFALEGLTDALRLEVGDAVDVVAVEPAWVDTGFDETARAELEQVDRSPAYREVYDLYGEDSVLDGGRLAVSPGQVARTIARAATAEGPRARYPVGWTARMIAATRCLPDSLQDWSRRTLAPVIAKYL